MAIEYWYPALPLLGSPWDDTDVGKCNNGINGPGLLGLSAGPDDTDFIRDTTEGSSLVMSIAPVGLSSDITTADTITQVRIFVRATRNAGDVDNDLLVDFQVSGVDRGGPRTVDLFAAPTFTNFTCTDAAWNADWTSVELSTSRIKLTTSQAGPFAAYEVDVSEIEVEVTYTKIGAENPDVWALAIAGKPLYFINSNDNKLFLTGQPVGREVSDAGIVRPTTGSLTTSGSAPKLTGIAWPTTYALTYSGIQPVTGEPRTADPALGTLALSGKVPTVGRNPIPGTASLSITEFSPARWTGLWFEGNAPTTVVTGNITVTTIDTLALLGYAPDVSIETPTSKVRTPEVANLAFASSKITSNQTDSITVPLGSVAITGRLTWVNHFAYPETDDIGFVGYRPKATGPDGQPIVVIGGPYEQGTQIVNRNAEADSSNRYNICARSGRKTRPGELVKDGETGELVLPEFADRRHPSSIGQGVGKGRYKKGALRPSDVGNERFIDTEYPDGVDPDDL